MLFMNHRAHFVFLILVCVWAPAAAAVAQEPAKSANDYVVAGSAALRAEKYEDALREYATALKLDPKNFGANVNSGVAYMLLERFEEALAALKVAAAIKPDESTIQLYLSQAYTHLAQQAADRPAAAKYLEQAVEAQPNNAAANYNLGVTLRDVGRINEAVAALKRATELKRDFVEAYFYLGKAYADLGQPQDYLTAVKEANRLRPDDNEILSELGHALRANQKFSEAIAPLLKVANALPDDVDAQYVLGNTYLMAQKVEEAIQTLNRVLVLQPDHADAREHLRVALARRDVEPKLASFRQRVLDEPRSGGAHAQLGQAYNSLGMYPKAEEEYLKAVNLESKNSDFQLRLCVNYSEWGKYDQAIDCYNKAAQLKQHHGIYLSLGDVYQKQGKLAEAIEAYKKSVELKPTFTYALYNLGFCYIKLGRGQEAIEPLQKLVEIEPKHAFGNHALGLAYVLTGNKTAAMQQYYILQNIDGRVAADLLSSIPK